MEFKLQIIEITAGYFLQIQKGDKAPSYIKLSKKNVAYLNQEEGIPVIKNGKKKKTPAN